MARQLETELEQTFEPGTDYTAHTYLAITLGNDVTLYLATAEFTFDDQLYLGRLKAKDALNLELTPAADAMNFDLTNIDLETGRELINTPNILNGTFAEQGVYFRNLDTNEEWLEPKIVGEIRTGDIDGDVIPITFISDIDAAEYNGLAIGTAFPDARNESQITVPPVNDIYNGGPAGGGIDNGGSRYNENDPFYEDPTSRYQLPNFKDVF